MCLNPITIINPSKYVSLKYRDRFLLQVPCGKCAQCMTNKANEWYFRSYYHSLDTLNNGGYIVFDTLTYANEYLPHISDYMDIPQYFDYPCFNSSHVKNFNKKLRRYCDKYDSKYTFFLTSEYGTSEHHTHRPHYHLLLYCDGKVPPLEMSALISKAWSFGRTDGIKFKNMSYVMHNIFDSSHFSESLRTCRYVSKYVQKSCKFQTEIDRRINSIMYYVAKKMQPVGVDLQDNYDWLSTISAKRYRMRLNRLCNQFHRQSLGFGACYFRDIDVNDVMVTGKCDMPDSRKVKLVMPLPTYYKRKLFYDCVRVDGNYTWIPNEDGYKFLRLREAQSFDSLVDRFTAYQKQTKINYNPSSLANYVLNIRGRIRAHDKCYDVLDRIKSATYYPYVTMSDKEHLGNLGVSPVFIGNNTIGYSVDRLHSYIRFGDFIAKNVMVDSKLEHVLDRIYSQIHDIDEGRQRAFSLRQRLVNLYHHLGFT